MRTTSSPGFSFGSWLDSRSSRLRKLPNGARECAGAEGSVGQRLLNRRNSSARVSALRIFVAHPSGFLTDCKANGDGLVAYGFLEQLGRRGHEIHVAVERAEIAQPLPANVVLHHIGDNGRTPRPVFMARMRMLFDRVRRKTQFDVIHQLNPVFSGMSLALAG